MASDGDVKLQSDLDSLLDEGTAREHMDEALKDNSHGKAALENTSEPAVSTMAKEFTTRALHFLSTANNETLGACFVGLGAITYFVLGRLGLILIGTVGGVILHATWEGDTGSQADEATKAHEARKRREKSLDIIKRILDHKQSTEEEHKEDAERSSPFTIKELDFSSFQSETRGALEEFTTATIRDYVKWWYSPLLPMDQSFPTACRNILTRFLLAISNQIARKRAADTFLDFVTNSSSILIVFLSELGNALKIAPGETPLEAVEQYIYHNPGCSLANVLDDNQQEKKLKGIAEDILQNFLDLKSYSCEPVRIFLREVLAGLILEMTIVSCSRPDFINDWIIYSLEDGETTELVQAIDAGVSGATANGATIPVAAAIVEQSTSDAINGSPGHQPKAVGEHKRTMSRAEEAMEEAMREAKRLTELIVEEEAKKGQEGTKEHASGMTAKTPIIKTATEEGTESAQTIVTSPTSLDNDVHSSSQNPRSEEGAKPSFTTFDQIISSTPTALQNEIQGDVRTSQSNTVPPMTLHNATVSIFDDYVPGEKGSVKSKPSVDYLLQIEPAVSQYPGWMIPRKFSDFETLHEVLRRISVISGVTAFADQHQSLPGWKGKTKSTLRTDLERYLRDALSFQPLAESEGMKRFLEKDQGLGKSSPGATKSGFGFPTPAAFETMGKGMLDVLTSAPKGAASGGKAVVGGVTGVLGGIGSIGQKKPASSSHAERDLKSGTPSMTSLSRTESNSGPSPTAPRQSQEGFQSFTEDSSIGQGRSFDGSRESISTPPLPARPSYDVGSQRLESPVTNGSTLGHDFGVTKSDENSAAPISGVEDVPIHLPPPPSEISDDYSTVKSSPKPSFDDNPSIRTSTSTNPPSHTTQNSQLPLSSTKSSQIPQSSPEPPAATNSTKSTPAPLSLPETTVAIELFFATITELYSLSSAWSLRLTLLSAAKTYLLRPSNPNLEAIRHLLQSTLIDPYTSDAGIASLIHKMRQNALPTEEELKAWPDPNALPEEQRLRESEKKRKKARKLLTERGMPTALTGVMGQAASGEALGKVFDCLQGEKVAKGLVFAVVLQAVRAVTQ